MISLNYLISACIFVCVSAEIIRPCPENDNACIGAWLAEHSSCSVSAIPEDQSKLDPYNIDYYFFGTPYVNVTEERTNIVINGLNQSYVQDLFYNTDSRKAVLTTYYPYFDVESDATFHAWITGEEGFQFSTHQIGVFTNLTLTTIFNDYEHAELSDSVTFPYMPTQPTFDSGDTVAVALANDARIGKIVEAWIELPFVATLEAFRYRGPDLVDHFANYKLCKFSEPASVV